MIIAHGDVFPYTHDIGALLDRAEGIGEAVPDEVRKRETLTIYSGGGKYPDPGDEEETTTREEYDEAMEDAAAIVGWAAQRVEALAPEADEARTDVSHPQALAKADRETDPT